MSLNRMKTVIVGMYKSIKKPLSGTGFPQKIKKG
jgi:hypothetical protein